MDEKAELVRNWLEKARRDRHGKSVSDPNAFYEVNADYQPPDSNQRSLF